MFKAAVFTIFSLSLVFAMESEPEILIVGAGRSTLHIKNHQLNSAIKTLDTNKDISPDFKLDISSKDLTITDRFSTIIFENLPNNAVNETSISNALNLLKENGIIAMNYPGAFLCSNIPSGEGNLTGRSSSNGSGSTGSDEEEDNIERYLEFSYSNTKGFYHLQKTGTPNDYNVYKHDEVMQKFSTKKMTPESEKIALAIGFLRFKKLINLNDKIDFQLVTLSGDRASEKKDKRWEYNGNVIWIKEECPDYFIIGKKERMT